MTDTEKLIQEGKDVGHFITHGIALIIGLLFLIVGMAMGVSVVLLPVGVGFGATGFLLIVWGLYTRPQTTHSGDCPR